MEPSGLISKCRSVPESISVNVNKPYGPLKTVITTRKQSLGQGNMFTGVRLSTGGVHGPGGAWSRGCMVPGGAWPQGGAWSWGGAWSQGGAWSWGVHGPRGFMVLGGAWSLGVCMVLGDAWSGGCIVPLGVVHGPGVVPGGDPPDGYCCRRYASYWNAFLLK